MSEATLLLFGSQGQVGREFCRLPLPAPWRLLPLDRAACDLTDRTAIRRAIEDNHAAAVINAAAYTAVDRAESEADLAYAVNAAAPGAMAEACAGRAIPLLHLSTDYVFDGTGNRPWREDDPIAPRNVYGASKAAGEAAIRAAGGSHLILRTSWVFSPFGNNFVKTMLRLGRERPELRVVDDQLGCPTAAEDLARLLLTLLPRLSDPAAGGTFHYCGAGPTSWYGFASAIFDLAAAAGVAKPRITPVSTAAFPTPARRPAYSVLDCQRLAERHGLPSTPWRQGLVRCLEQIL